MAGVLKASLALHLLSVLLLPLLIATNDFSSILSITNNCSFTVWPAAIPVGGGTQLDPGQTWTIGVPAGGISSGRLWGRTGCSFRTGQGVCKTGDCAGVLSCTQSGEPPNTLAEFSLGGTIDFFDISVIDGFNLAMDFLPVPAKGAPVCSKGPRCLSSQCPDAYRTPTEDKTFACPRGTNYQLVFCPSIDRTPSLSPTLVPSRASSSPQLAPSPAPAIQLAPSLSPTLVPLPSGEIATRSSSGSRVSVILAIAGGCIFLTVLFIAIFFIRKRRNRHQDTEEVEEFGELQGIPIKFTFQQLRVATEDFRVILGEGGFGTVFKGQFGEDIIAVKRLDQTGQGKREFLAEVQTIGSIHHINLVRLIGFCAEKSHRLLVYEFMPKGSLDRWIYYRQGNSTRAMDWGMRCKIITHIAKGLCYLHEECTKRIAHLDVKPQNILLDDNFNAKLSDFGMCKLIDRDKSQVITRMRGTPGYLAPEWLTSQITEKADIYSFGVVVMEIISGRKNLDTSRSEESVHLITLLEEMVQNGQLADLIDKHNSDMQVHKQDIIQMMKLAMWCLQIDSKKRPRMSDVVKVLEGDMNVETNIDHNFVATCQTIIGVAGNASSSSPHLASDVSGPR